MTAGDHVEIGAALQVEAEIETGADAAAKGAFGFKDMPLFGRLHPFNFLDHPPGNHHGPHLQAALPADRFKVLFAGIPFNMGDLELGLTAGGARDLV